MTVERLRTIVMRIRSEIDKDPIFLTGCQSCYHSSGYGFDMNIDGAWMLHCRYCGSILAEGII